MVGLRLDDGAEVWVVYERPEQNPEGFWAELYEVRKGEQPIKVGRSIKSSHLHLIEKILEEDNGATQLRQDYIDGDNVVGNWA